MPATPLSDGSRHYNQARRIHPHDPVAQLAYYLPAFHSSSGSSATSHAFQKHVKEELTSAQQRMGPLRCTRSKEPNNRAALLTQSSSCEFKNDPHERPQSHFVQFSSAGPDSSSSSSSSSASHYSTRLSKALAAGAHTASGSKVGSLSQFACSFQPLARATRSQRRVSRVSQMMTDDEDGLGITSIMPDCQPSNSPNESSGFSEGTIRETKFNELHFSNPACQIGLQDSSTRMKTSGELASVGFVGQLVDSTPYKQGKFAASFSKSGGDLTPANTLRRPWAKDLSASYQSKKQQQAHAMVAMQSTSRIKRRNIKRINRRLMSSDPNQLHHHLSNPYALSELFSQSEIPGFREIFASDSYLRKFCWIVAFLFMTVLSLNDMTELITEYYDYPVTVDVRLRDSARLPFPSVTVCNLNVVRFSALCSGSNSRFNLTNQIPSELRDKLCGIQVEKTNSSGGGNGGGESDINDINNIGISTTTTVATTLATSTAGSSGSPGELAGGSGDGTTPGVGTSVPKGGDAGSNSGPGFLAQGGPIAGAHQTTMATPTKGGGNGGGFEHKSRVGDGSGPPIPSLTTISDLADTGDFAEPNSLIMEREANSRYANGRGWRPRRSIKLPEWNLGNSPPILRPFASAKSQLRIHTSKPGGASVAPPSKAALVPLHQQRVLLSTSPPHGSLPNDTPTNGRQFAGNNGKLYTGAGQSPHASHLAAVLVPASGAASGPKGTYQNPLLGNLGPSTTQGGGTLGGTTIPPPQTTTTTAFVPPALPEDFELTERQERELQENLTNWLAVMYQRDPKLTWSLGHQFDDMVLRCTMKSINCTHQRSFENSFTPTEGNCFTYRSKIRRRSPSGNGLLRGAGQPLFEEANLASINHGLELVLNLEKNEYISGSSQVGALVMVHHPSDLGYAASEATFVAPEFTTYIGLKMVNLTRLPAPYPEYCVDSWPAKFADTLTHNSTYSQQSCIRICLQKTIQSQCHCQSAFLPIVEIESGTSSQTSTASTTNSTVFSTPNVHTTSAVNQSNLPTAFASRQGVVTGGGSSTTAEGSVSPSRIIICDTRKLATRHCVRDVMLRPVDRVHNCECPPKCQVVRYEKTISMARWPTREDKVSFDRGKMDVNFQNLAKVIVYFRTMTCEEVTQQAVFNAAKLFSALGGIMGMYVGFSFLSVFEIFEVMSRKMWHHFKVKLGNLSARLVGNSGPA